MSQTTTPPLTRTDRLLAALLVVAAVGQLVSSTLASRFGGQFTTADRAGEPLVVPPGGAFSIWGLVIALSISYAVWADRTAHRSTGGQDLRARLTRPLLVVFLGFSAWIAAAELEPTWTTLVVFAVMLAGLLRALAVALADRAALRTWSRLGRGLLWALLGIYTGWSSVAIWINLTTALTESGAPVESTLGLIGQAAVLAGATGTAVIIVTWTRGLLPYAAAVAWALGGVVLSTLTEGAPVLAAMAAVGLALVLAALVRARRSPAAA